MSRIDSLRAVIREQGLGEVLRRAEFQAILEALAPDEEVRALAQADLRGRRGYLVATGRRLFFAHAGVAGTAISPLPATLEGVRHVQEEDGSVTLVFHPGGRDEVRLDEIPKGQAEVLARRIAGAPGDSRGG